MAEPRNFAQRVFIEDVRNDGKHLRVTWHAELPGFIVSNWHDDVCVGATRIAVDDAPRLINLLTNGLAASLAEAQAQACAPAQSQTGTHASLGAHAPPHRARPSRLLEKAAQLGRRAESRINKVVRARLRSTKSDPVADVADVVDLSRHRSSDSEPRWMYPPQ